jgi:hypothetical protein
MGFSSKPVRNDRFQHDLADFAGVQDYHGQKACLVCGLGPSINLVTDYVRKRIKTIGVNYIGMYFKPSYNLILDKLFLPVGDIIEEKMQAMVTENKAPYTFSKYYYDRCKSPLVFFNSLDRKEGSFSEAVEKGCIYTAYTSTISAISLAFILGFKQIGLVGFDIKEHPTMEQYLEGIEKVCGSIQGACRTEGWQIFNLSRDSLVTAFPPMDIHDFMEEYA